METQIQTYAFSKRTPGHVTLFGYSSKSIPGLEINGLGKYGRTLKEKIIFLTRSRQLPIPLNRYVISAEYELDQDPQCLKWLELPILVLYWYLAGLINMSRLDNCLVVGAVAPSGEILEKIAPELIQLAKEESWLWLTSQTELSLPTISPVDLLGHVPSLSFSPAHRLSAVI
jgi:hypothetical protein